MVKIGILGAAGRMGQTIAREILLGKYSASIVAAVEHSNHPLLGQDIGTLTGARAINVAIDNNKEKAFQTADVLVDFSIRESVEEHAELARKNKKALVIGTTGMTAHEYNALQTAAKETPILYSANMSVGINLMLSVIEQTAKKLGPEYDIEIFEAHHRHKADAPSGTTLLLGAAAAKGRGVKWPDAMITNRHGSRQEGTIGISVFRGGDIAGEHTVTFAGAGERLEISHKASDRSLFAKGALRAALWISGKPAGYYSMQDVLF